MSAATTEITIDSFESIIDKPGIVLIDWWAAWCGPCRMFAPIFEAAAGRHADLTWGKVDTQAQQELAGGFGIQSIPTLSVFRDGILLYSEPGAMPASALDKLVAQIRELDMDEVRRKIAEREAASPAADSGGGGDGSAEPA